MGVWPGLQTGGPGAASAQPVPPQPAPPWQTEWEHSHFTPPQVPPCGGRTLHACLAPTRLWPPSGWGRQGGSSTLLDTGKPMSPMLCHPQAEPGAVPCSLSRSLLHQLPIAPRCPFSRASGRDPHSQQCTARDLLTLKPPAPCLEEQQGWVVWSPPPPVRSLSVSRGALPP